MCISYSFFFFKQKTAYDISVFFFQAEDGIRDRSPSRGLGDVYKRQIVANKYGKEIADNTSILYGGSCKPSNAKELFSNPDVDGGLIGGAALKVSDFKGIIDAFNA